MADNFSLNHYLYTQKNGIEPTNSNYTEEFDEIVDVFTSEVLGDSSAMNSVMKIDDDTTLDRKGFESLLKNALGSTDGLSESQMDYLFDLMNTNSDDDILDYDELSVIADKNNDISGFYMWEVLYSSAKSDRIAQAGAALEKQNEDSTSGVTGGTTTDTTTGTDDSQGTSSDVSQPSTENLTYNQALMLAGQLNDAMKGLGTDEEQMYSILANDDLTADDLTLIMSVYNEKYGSLVQHIEDDFSGSEQDEMFKLVTDKLVEAAENGNELAVDVMAKEMYNATAERNGTSDEFVAGIMDNASSEVISKLSDRYSKVNPGRSLLQDIRGDFSFGTEDKYLDRVKDSVLSNSTSEKGLSSAQAELLADDLNASMKGWGTDEAAIESIINNPDLSPEDMVKIIEVYTEKYGSLVQHIDDDFSGKAQDKLLETIADKLVTAAENGDSTAIDMLCKEFHNATGARNGTVDEFVAKIMAEANDKVLSQMADRYQNINGTDIISDIKGDFSFGTEDRYIKRINDAII